MGDIDGKRDASAVVKDRTDDRHVAGMRATLIGVIGDEDIALRHILAEASYDEADLIRKCTGEESDAIRLRHEITIGAADAAGIVEHLVDDGAHAGARCDDRHLVDGGDHLAVDDLERRWVEVVVGDGARPALRHRARWPHACARFSERDRSQM